VWVWDDLGWKWARHMTRALAWGSFLAAVALASPSRVQPVLPGEVQPLAPGQRNAPPLPQIELSPAIPEVLKVEYASNGHLEVAHALALLPDAELNPGRALRLAQQIASRVLEARSSLDEVDLSFYRRAGYGGIGGPLPYFTASVPRARLADFLGLEPRGLSRYERLWLNPWGGSDGPGSTPRLEGTLEHDSARHPGGAVGLSLFRGNPGRPEAALTFDDAPHPLYTPLLLDTLRRGGARATFFCIGRNALAYPYFVRDMVQEGHEIGNHTFHHVRLSGLDEASIREELSLANEVLEGITHQKVRYFRPPGGRLSPAVLEVARELGLTVVFWTDDPADFDNLGTLRLENRLLRRLRPGGIVLLHDNVLQTIQALPDFLELARRRGIRLVSTGELARGELRAAR
jgi:peptidoglycan/xylan/chitin deacetylase (PgdA/CDA1 family)